jgi:transcriptional regulator with XRE-family HTH domain
MDGQELRRIRRQLKLSQKELAELFGVPQGTISRWETGAARILHPKMMRWALRGIAAIESRELLRST